jgi:SAM-dependent methyltransferase
VRKALKVLRRDGVGGLARATARQVKHSVRQYLESAFDRKYGTDTSRMVELQSLAIESPNVAHAGCGRYQAVTTSTFRRMLREGRFDPRGFVFLDVGSGKGRALMLATSYPFTRIIGVEFSRELVDIALVNLGRFRAKTGRGGDIEVLCMDALDYALPSAPLALFLYNSFSGPVMEGFLARLEGWLIDTLYPLLVFYRNPTCQEMFDRVPRLEVIVKKASYCVYRRRTSPTILDAAGAVATGADCKRRRLIPEGVNEGVQQRIAGRRALEYIKERARLFVPHLDHPGRRRPGARA